MLTPYPYQVKDKEAWTKSCRPVKILQNHNGFANYNEEVKIEVLSLYFLCYLFLMEYVLAS